MFVKKVYSLVFDNGPAFAHKVERYVSAIIVLGYHPKHKGAILTPYGLCLTEGPIEVPGQYPNLPGASECSHNAIPLAGVLFALVDAPQKVPIVLVAILDGRAVGCVPESWIN